MYFFFFMVCACVPWERRARFLFPRDTLYAPYITRIGFRSQSRCCVTTDLVTQLCPARPRIAYTRTPSLGRFFFIRSVITVGMTSSYVVERDVVHRRIRLDPVPSEEALGCWAADDSREYGNPNRRLYRNNWYERPAYMIIIITLCYGHYARVVVVFIINYIL